MEYKIVNKGDKSGQFSFQYALQRIHLGITKTTEANAEKKSTNCKEVSSRK